MQRGGRIRDVSDWSAGRVRGRAASRAAQQAQAVDDYEGEGMFTTGEQVYHRTRREVGTYTGPGAGDTSWVYFESDGEEVEVTTEYLETTGGVDLDADVADGWDYDRELGDDERAN